MKHPETKQQGVVLLLLLLVFLVAGSSLLFGTLNSRQDVYIRQQEELSTQMQLAKEALLAFAANSSSIYNNERGPGFFPCPDTTNAGSADSTCNSNAVNVGRLPEYIEVDDNKIFFNSFYADNNQQFWYAVAPNYVYATDENDRRAQNRTSVALEISASRLALGGTSDVVALIIAPGEALDFQNRTAAPLAASNFLEGGNETSDLNFAAGNGANPDTFNDQVIAITHNELMAFIGMKAAVEIKRALDFNFENQAEPRHYPGDPNNPLVPNQYHTDFATELPMDSWLADNPTANNEQWARETIYTLNSATQASIQFAGCPNMSFMLDRDHGVSRTGDFC